MDTRVGIAVATFNSRSFIGGCLEGFDRAEFRVVLFDDASQDDTVEVARQACPGLVVIEGDGDQWWAGGTRAAVDTCFEMGCDHVVMLNPDVLLAAEDILEMVEYANGHPRTIVAALVVEHERSERIAWAGSHFKKLPLLPIYTSRYVKKPGGSAAELGSSPYSVDEVHGRGVVISRQIYQELGALDSEVFPHYGADNDYSLRAREKGIELVIMPSVRAQVHMDNTGMEMHQGRDIAERVRRVRDYLTERKHGDALRVWWKLMRRHVPAHAVVPSFLFNISLNIARRLR
jgi:GT2 family glycosyltransferase